jgi:hypothetical protein
VQEAEAEVARLQQQERQANAAATIERLEAIVAQAPTAYCGLYHIQRTMGSAV